MTGQNRLLTEVEKVLAVEAEMKRVGSKEMRDYSTIIAEAQLAKAKPIIEKKTREMTLREVGEWLIPEVEKIKDISISTTEYRLSLAKLLNELDELKQGKFPEGD